jgi:hypothetical protein|tara:strand:- start:20056 stop:21060 length:1005 start_codon:yes stop_codon:yes gene_type:complete
MRNNHKIYLASFIFVSLTGSAALAKPIYDCAEAISAEELDSQQESMRQFAAIATVSYVPRNSKLAIWDTDTNQWHIGNSGSALRSGDAVCLIAGVEPAMIRQSSEDHAGLKAVEADQLPFVIKGEQTTLPSSKISTYIGEIDWPTSREIAAIERGLGRPGRQRTGATRGMSVGSTPRAVYLGGAGVRPDITKQKMLIGLENQMWGWCSTDERVAVFDHEERLATLNPFEPEKSSLIKGATEIRISTSSDGFRKIDIEWINDKDLPIPDWIKQSDDALLIGIWLSEHDSGEYQWIGHSLLHRLARSRPAALYYLAHRSNCGSGHSYKPSLNLVRN